MCVGDFAVNGLTKDDLRIPAVEADVEPTDARSGEPYFRYTDTPFESNQ
jgi:hypothetical protein